MRRALHLRLLACALVVGTTVAVTSPPVASQTDTPTQDCDWPMWGDELSRDFATTCSGITTANASELRRIWFFNTRDVVTATPAVVDGTAYVGDWTGRFYALRVSNGRPRWQYQAEPHENVYAGQIVSSAAVEQVEGGRTVYFGSGKTLYALRASNGELRWKRELGTEGQKDDPTEIESSPVVVDGAVIVGTDVHNTADGHPAGVYAFDAATGEPRWERVLAPAGDTGGGCADVWSSPSVDIERRMVFVGTGNCVTSPRGWGPNAEAIIALGLDDGAVRWTYQPHDPNRDDLDFAGTPNLFEAGGRVLVGLGNKDGAYYAVDRDTGALVWSTKVAEPGLTRPGSNFSTGGFIGPTAVADGVIVGGTAIGGAPYLHALDAATGAIRWQQPATAATYGAASVANGVVVIGGTDFTLRALDLATGDVLWSDEVAGAVSGGTAIVGDDIIAVAGIREPGGAKRSRTSGVYLYSLDGKPQKSATRIPKEPRTRETVPTTAPGTVQECVGSPCDVDFNLIQPPAGLTPSMTLEVGLDPWRVEVHTEGLGDPAAWLRPGTNAAQSGATRFGVFISERDDNPQGGLLCVLKADGSCTSKKIPRAGATYNRISLLAITDSDELPTPAEGVNRLAVTRSFDPPLAPVKQ